MSPDKNTLIVLQKLDRLSCLVQLCQKVRPEICPFFFLFFLQHSVVDTLYDARKRISGVFILHVVFSVEGVIRELEGQS